MDKKTKKCPQHKNQLLAPLGMAVLVKKGKELETTTRLNAEPLNDLEMEEMKSGNMAGRHFLYDGYCQDIPFSYL